MSGLFGKNRLRDLAREIPTDQITAHVELVRTWRDDYHSIDGRLKTDNETVREQQYNQDFFVTILGYRQPPNVPTTFTPKSTTAARQIPDAILHYKDATVDNMSAVIELKGAGINLDKPQQREGNLSAVQQAFKYKPQYPSCPFVVVSNFYEFRLYNNNIFDFEIWTLDDLVNPADDYLKFKTWYWVMHADRMVVREGASQTEQLLSVVRQNQERIGKDFYTDYKAARIELLRDIWRHNVELREDFDVAIEKAQTIIDRLVFCCFAEDIGLLPDDIINLVVRQARDSLYGEPLSEHFNRFFKAVDVGSTGLGIPEGYNGGLFADDPIIDRLVISDEVMMKLVKLANYDFEEDLPVNILGHIFEQSITDLEEIRRKVAVDNSPMGIEPPETASGLRRREGIYYTPDYIVQYIVQNTVGAYLAEHEERLKEEYGLKEDIQSKTYARRERQAYLQYQTILQGIRIIDPACGSGAFLVYAFDYLLKQNERVDAILGGTFAGTEQYVRDILRNNLFGVDLNSESVEITKLSLWLKTAQRGKKLTALDQNIKCGNSLINDGTITKTAFDWTAEFPKVMANGGFDVVVGNPPYVSAIEMNRHLPERDRTFMRRNYETARGAVDLYIYFFERGIQVLKSGGKLGFITPNRWLSIPYGEALRTWLLKEVRVESMLNCSDSRVFPDAATYPVVTILTKTEMGNKTYKITAGHLEEMTAIPATEQHDSTDLSSLPQNIWGFLLNNKLPVTQRVFDQAVSLAKVGEINATSTAAEADDYAAFISDQAPGQKIINTGTIDPYTTMWGLGTFTKQGTQYRTPYLDLDKVSEGRRKLYESPKIIVSKVALRCESVYDGGGQYASIDTNCVHTFSEAFLPEYVAAWMNSRLFTYVFTCLFDGARMSGGYLSFSAPNLRATPIAKISTDDQQIFVPLATRLAELYRAKDEADTNFRQIIMTTLELPSWPRTNNDWWSFDATTFIGNFRRRFTTAQVEDLMGAHSKHSAVVNPMAEEILKATREVDQRFYKIFKLTAEEIKEVEAMEFAVL